MTDTDGNGAREAGASGAEAAPRTPAPHRATPADHEIAVRLTALLVEDSPSDAALVAAVASHGPRHIDIHTVTTAAAALEALDDDPDRFDVVLLDLGLPDASGLDGLTQLVAAHPEVPVAVLTGDDDSQLATGAVARGAQEFLSKSDLTPDRLDRMVSQALIRHEHRRALARTEAALERARSEQRRVERRLTHQRHHDDITGLPNRSALLEHLDRATSTSTAEQPVFLLLLDLHHFGLINDSVGADMADRLLVALAGRLRRHCDAGEMVARIGGDELALLCAPGRGSARARAETLCAEIGRPLSVGDASFELEAAVGIATALAPTTGLRLFTEAQAALSRAKLDGAAIVTYDAQMRDEAARLLSTEGWIRAALRDGGLRLQFQPIVDLTDGQMVGAEALLRLTTRTGQQVPPSQFIPVAEQSDLIVPLGTWVIEEVGRWVAEWRDVHPDRRLQVSVNVSARQLATKRNGNRQLTQVIDAALPDQLLVQGLMVELTETALLEASRAAVTTLTELRRLGHRLAIDDFGTGYGSLTYLWRYQVDALKIDQSFVQAMADDHSAHDIVTNVVGLGRSMGITTVAEGVETAEQRDMLAAAGCHEAQGYLFAHPLEADEITDLLRHPQPLG